MKNKISLIIFIVISTFGLLIGCNNSRVTKGESSEIPPELTVETTVAEHDISSLVSYAGLIVAGTVLTVEDFRLSEDGLYNTSHIEISISDVYKGNNLTGSKVIVEINSYKGIRGVKTEDEPIIPSFSTDDNVLLFLKENDHGSFYIVGINQGIYFKSDDARDIKNYSRQANIGYGPESISLDELNKYLIK